MTPAITASVAVIGSGFAGLCMAIKLKAAGIHDLIILEQDQEPGGTWTANRYPGCACDIPSHLYSFSFAQNADWSRLYPARGELWAYTMDLIRRFDLAPHMRLGCRVTGGRFDDAIGGWRLETTQGNVVARAVVAATGPLSRPALPDIPGRDQFEGPMFHAARWNPDIDLTGKRVAIVGTGASAIQIVPEIAPTVAQLDIYQRTPPWVLPRPDRPITKAERFLLRHVPPSRWLFRGLTYVGHEWRAPLFTRYTGVLRVLEQAARRYIKRQIPDDPELRRRITPNYRLGCKRILLSNDYYRILRRRNVAVISDGISAISPDGIVDRNGDHRPADIVIFATGFDVAGATSGLNLVGRAGQLLAADGDGAMAAYKGITVAGFPNLFLLLGPNTGLGHNSMIYMIESAVGYVVDGIQQLLARGLGSLSIDPAVQDHYNASLQARLAGSVWGSGCRSWYVTASGHNFTIWPGFTFTYRQLTRRFDLSNYQVRGFGNG